MLFDLIFYFGLGGCYMSNETIAAAINSSPRAVQLARKHLEEKLLIITARANPYTVTMWNRYHPAVRQCQILLYPKGNKMENPFYNPLAPKSGKRGTPTINNQGAKNAR
jgi:hypothetical protein